MQQSRSRHARDTRWPQQNQDQPFTPEPVERFEAYATASRRSYMSLLGALADLSSGQGSLRAAADARIRLMGAHLAQVGQLRDFYGIAR